MPHTSPDSNAHTLRQLEALAALAEIGPEQTERDIIQVGADVAQRATDSQVAYLHFLNEDEETIELGTWSHDTLTHCSAVHDRHYPVSAAGIWADTVRLRRPVSHNEYASVVGRRGLPPGIPRSVAISASPSSMTDASGSSSVSGTRWRRTTRTTCARWKSWGVASGRCCWGGAKWSGCSISSGDSST
ncbi:MAG: GAF domain-containing protein [Gemmatimonadetes bacterium]|nr:GAF domain-containing protein [Gemmatimonadota bacterium]